MTTPLVVAALYKFTRFTDVAALRAPLQAVCDSAGVKGTLLLAGEGINGTIAGTRDGIDSVLAAIRALPGCADLEHKESTAAEMPFYRMKVRLKKEIVTMGVPDIDPVYHVGTYIDPADWNALISDPGVIVIDTRNDYEVGIGSFKGAVNPETKSFGEFPDWFRDFRAKLPDPSAPPKIAMFCTGGIRCEKSTAFLRSEGLGEVFHLRGGILKYLEAVPAEDSLWEGECFVFDQRVSVGHGLTLGSYDICHACRLPLSAEDKQAPQYVEGISCRHCHAERDDDQRARYAERQRQVEAADKRGEAHVGARYAADDAGHD
ncbi:oxygen-dependent tRNA uridine(34) hydroxylase TrhO [Govanella unica]|uniref:tRNA uridine(34) hydroxylase n=1 Tax=Govanella unica TaxID=2975056 RepID=A0A9X3Z7J3_9PROT|nr:rhodanese-related sulfurtransferase [Govania unica]MDA5194310.1 rhodanese-related sulfurtransferase [Govania unica]